MYNPAVTKPEATGTPLSVCASFQHHLLVSLLVVALILEEQLLGNEVSSECNGGYAEAGEGALEAVEAGEGSGVSPLLTGKVSMCRMGHVRGIKRTIVPMGRPWYRSQRQQRTSWGRSR